MATLSSKLLDEWHPTRNGDLDPTTLTHGSKKRVWWRCHSGHEWQATIKSRSLGSKCPTCRSLSASQTALVQEWHPSLNGKLQPSDISYSSNKIVWWRCDSGHEWQARIDHRSAGS